jgi:endoglucanase
VRLSVLIRPRRHRAFLARCVAVAFVLLAVAAGGNSDPPSVRVVGKRLVDPNGTPIRLLGVNRSGTEYACISGEALIKGPTDAQAIAAMAAWRITTVRIPLNEDCWLGINGAPADTSGAPYRAAIKDYVAGLHDAGMRVVLDLHWNAPGTARATGQQPMADLDHAPAFWSSVARTFRANPAVVFDLYNEPYDISWRCWRDGCVLPAGWRTAGMQRLVNAVRSTGAHQPIILSGIARASDLSSWLRYRPRDPRNQLVAGFHVYDFSQCNRLACWRNNVQRLARTVPVVTTELGQRDCSSPFIERFMGWADSVSVSYLGWTWDTAGCGAPALIQSWDGTPTASGDRLRSHLTRAAGHR